MAQQPPGNHPKLATCLNLSKHEEEMMLNTFLQFSSAVIDDWLCSFGGFVYPRGKSSCRTALGRLHTHESSHHCLIPLSVCSQSLSLTGWAGGAVCLAVRWTKRWSLWMQTRQHLLKSRYAIMTAERIKIVHLQFKHLPELGVVFQNVIQFDFRS